MAKTFFDLGGDLTWDDWPWSILFDHSSEEHERRVMGNPFTRPWPSLASGGSHTEDTVVFRRRLGSRSIVVPRSRARRVTIKALRLMANRLYVVGSMDDAAVVESALLLLETEE